MATNIHENNVSSTQVFAGDHRCRAERIFQLQGFVISSSLTAPPRKSNCRKQQPYAYSSWFS